jgi:hypothetical protein
MAFVKDHNSNQDIDGTFNRFEAECLKSVCLLCTQIGTKDLRCDVRWSAMLMSVFGDSTYSRWGWSGKLLELIKQKMSNDGAQAMHNL